MSKLALGTAQFGLDYGINNRRGMIPEGEIAQILSYATVHGIDTLDTAAAYGDSEERIGRYQAGSGQKFKIVSKLPKDAGDPVAALTGSLAKLKANSLYGYLFHDFQTYENNRGAWDELVALKAQGQIKKIGLSLYYPAELEKALADGLMFDLVQVPYNVFDRRFERYLPDLKKLGVEVHVRSIFLQGLFFREVATLSHYFDRIKNKLTRLREIAGREKSSLLEVTLGFALANPLIDKVVIGVDNLSNLQEILAAEDVAVQAAGQTVDLSELREDDEAIILPFNWEKEKASVS